VCNRVKVPINVAWLEKHVRMILRPVAKIVFQEIATSPRFAIDTEGYYTNNKVLMIPSYDMFLLGILNSKWAWIFFNVVCSQLQGKTISQQPPNISRLPIPEASQSEKQEIIGFVELCLSEMSDDKMQETEKELDNRVARLFNLSI
jgi:hypothetical protein